MPVFRNANKYKRGHFYADASAIKRLYYAVDSTWISQTFAVTFLVLCYVRGTIDGNTPRVLKVPVSNIANR